jgi:hypothetical protein
MVAPGASPSSVQHAAPSREVSAEHAIDEGAHIVSRHGEPAPLLLLDETGSRGATTASDDE